MTSAEPQFAPPHDVEIGAGESRRKIAFRERAGRGPCVVWLGGFRSDMASTKAERLDDWAKRHGRAYLRFDYSGHGLSAGRFEDGTISLWLEDSLAMIGRAGPCPVVVGSSMGAWLALLAARTLREAGQPLGGLVLIAPAVDFTEALIWAAMPEAVRRTVETEGRWLRPTSYGPEPYAITRALIEDGRRHLMLDGPPIVTGCPVHVLQGMADPDVPWRHAMRLVEQMPWDEEVTKLIRDGDHRLSRPGDLDRLEAALDGLLARGQGGA